LFSLCTDVRVGGTILTASVARIERSEIREAQSFGINAVLDFALLYPDYLANDFNGLSPVINCGYAVLQ
jgi:hypothetical protein